MYIRIIEKLRFFNILCFLMHFPSSGLLYHDIASVRYKTENFLPNIVHENIRIFWSAPISFLNKFCLKSSEALKKKHSLNLS